MGRGKKPSPVAPRLERRRLGSLAPNNAPRHKLEPDPCLSGMDQEHFSRFYVEPQKEEEVILIWILDDWTGIWQIAAQIHRATATTKQVQIGSKS